MSELPPTSNHHARSFGVTLTRWLMPRQKVVGFLSLEITKRNTLVSTTTMCFASGVLLMAAHVLLTWGQLLLEVAVLQILWQHSTPTGLHETL